MAMTLNMSANSTAADLLNSTSPLPWCSVSTLNRLFWTFTAFCVANILLLLPLLVFVIFLGCRRQRESPPPMLSHSDVVAYNAVAMEMIQVAAVFCFIVNIFVKDKILNVISQNAVIVMSSVKPEFQMLTCVELYLAVVFPISYRRFKTSAGVTVRNASVACVWLVGVSAVFIVESMDHFDAWVAYFLHMAVILSVISFCCVSVLLTLRRHGPGDGTSDREPGDQSKRRAFYTILVIMTVLLLSLGGVLVCNAVDTFLGQKENAECLFAPCAEWMSLPCSFVLPLLFLQRAEKLWCCKRLKRSNE